MTRAFLILSTLICTAVTSVADNRSALRILEYKGWKNSYILTSGDTELVVVPAIARIMNFSRHGGENTLWTDTKLYGHQENIATENWFNYGGSKLWLAPQSKWPDGGHWPPDIYLDRSPCTAERNGDVITITSVNSPFSGLRMKKTIRPISDKPGFSLHITIENVSAQTVQWSIWEVTQLQPGGRILSPNGTVSSFTEENSVKNHALLSFFDHKIVMETTQVKGNRGVKTKIMQSSGWLAYALNDTLFIKKFKPVTAAMLPPGCFNSETYIRGDYVELETIGPYKNLKPGEKCSYLEEWYLLPLPPDASIQEISSIIDKFNKE